MVKSFAPSTLADSSREAGIVTYQKSLLDYYGQPKLAFYAHRMAFQDVLACSGNVDMVYGPDDTLPVIVLNIGKAQEVTVCVEFISEDGTAVFCENYEHVELQKGRSVTCAAEMELPELPDGIYTIQYSVYRQ